VNNILEKLIGLQKLDLEIRKLGHSLQQIPKKEKLIDKTIEASKLPFDEARARSGELKARIDALAESVIALEENERQLKLRMPKIKSNEEYSALLKEMDNSKKKREESEEEQLKLIEESESLERELPALEALYLEQEKGVSSERDLLEKEKADLESVLIRRKEERNKLQADFPQNWLSKYNHIASARNGLAVVPVRKGICQGCFIGVRPKIVQDLHYAEEVISCEGCQRLLYLDEETNA
jgi:predicted  nucleic acid-binding Zn-ribbon protein